MASVDWSDVLGVLVGGSITALFSWYYYQRSSTDLKDEAAALREESAKLKRHTTLILRGLEEAGLVEYVRNEQGEITNMVIKAGAVLRGSGSLSATHTEKRDEDDVPAD